MYNAYMFVAAQMGPLTRPASVSPGAILWAMFFAVVICILFVTFYLKGGGDDS